MRFWRHLTLAVLVSLVIAAFGPAFGFAQEPEPIAPLSQQEPAQVAEQLKTIQRDITWLTSEVTQRRKQQAAAGKDEAAEMNDEIADLEHRLEKARLSFIATASQVELPAPESKEKPKKRDLLQEAQAFVEPIFDALHRVSEKPRRIEAYRNQIYLLRTRLSQLDSATANLDRVIKAKTYSDFQGQLEDSRQSLLHDRDEVQVQADTYQRRLDQELSDHRSVMQVVSEGIWDFLSSKGRNLLIAMAVFAFVFWLAVYCRRYLFRLRALRSRPQLIRTLQPLYGALAGFVALLAVLITLHVLNDWFLVTVITVALIGVAWTFKAFMPVFINEMKLVLNVGPVKQGERVVWQGVPWLVRTLGFRSVLVNPDLQGGEVTVSASALAGLISRTPVTGEPWFPTQTGDFALLDDGVYGRVETQTPEIVVMNVGSTRKHYSTSSFLAKSPQNFSRGFELTVEFGVRHEGAPPRLDALRLELDKAVKAALASRVDGSHGDFKDLQAGVVAATAGASRVWARADCPGRLAGRRDELKRDLLSAAAEAWRAAFAGR